MQAVVLTGRTLPGHDAETTWSAVAKLFKLEPEAFKRRILARCPTSIRDTLDNAEAERIQRNFHKYGAETSVIEFDGDKWYFRRGQGICGPVPLAYLEEEAVRGQLADSVQVKSAGDTRWQSLVEALEDASPQMILDTPPDMQSLDELPPPLPNVRDVPEKIRSLSEKVLSATPGPVASVSNKNANSPVIDAQKQLGKISITLFVVFCLYQVSQGGIKDLFSGISSNRAIPFVDKGKIQATDIYGASDQKIALSNVASFAIGTWTSVDRNSDGRWHRVNIKPNGAITIQSAEPASNDWGDGIDEGSIEPLSAKYHDNGQRWYGFKASGSQWSLFIITSDGELMYFPYADRKESVTLKREDIFPFSK